MDEDRNRLEKTIESDRLEELLRDDRELIAKLPAKIRRDHFFFAATLIWLAACIVVSLYLVMS